MIGHLRTAVVGSLTLLLAATGCASRAGAGGVLRSSDVRDAHVRPSAEAEWERLEPGRALSRGAVVRTGGDGRAKLSAGGTWFELGGSSEVLVVDANAVVARSGSVLGGGDTRILVDDAEGRRATTEAGVLRLDYGESVASYAGTVRVTAPGSRTVDVPPLHEMALGLAVADVHPIRPNPSDRWMVRHLADAIQVDRQLEPYARSFDVNTPGEANIEFLARYVRRDAISFVEALLRTRLAGIEKFDLLVVTFLAIERAGATGEPLPDAFAGVIALREAGATLGVTAQALGIAPTRLVGRILRAFTPNAPPQSIEPLPRPTPTRGGQAATPSPTATATASRSPTPRPTRSQDPTPEPSPSPEPTPSSSPSPSPTPTPTCQIEDIVAGRCTP